MVESNGMRRTYKKVLNYAPTSIAASTQQYSLAIGTDSISPGQAGITDATVPTGAKITKFVIQFPILNLSANALVVHTAVQYVKAGQTAINANVVGGNAQRNQVIKQACRVFGLAQNGSIGLIFKIPRRFQRLQESMQWIFTVTTNQISTQTNQVIYTFET